MSARAEPRLSRGLVPAPRNRGRPAPTAPGPAALPPMRKSSPATYCIRPRSQQQPSTPMIQPKRMMATAMPMKPAVILRRSVGEREGHGYHQSPDSGSRGTPTPGRGGRAHAAGAGSQPVPLGDAGTDNHRVLVCKYRPDGLVPEYRGRVALSFLVPGAGPSFPSIYVNLLRPTHSLGLPGSCRAPQPDDHPPDTGEKPTTRKDKNLKKH